MISRFTDPDDPLAHALAPPPDETAEQRADRVAREHEAQRVSDAIDEQLRQEKLAWKTRKTPFKLLLLGQSESGKSTTLKNLQITFAPAAWKAERASWRAVVQLNLVRSVNTILDVLADELAPPAARAPNSPPSHAFYPAAPPRPAPPAKPAPAFTQTHHLLKLRLAPLRRVEADLQQLLGAASSDAPDSPDSLLHALSLSGASSPADGSPVRERARESDEDGEPAARAPEVFVRSHRSWRDALRERTSRSPPSPGADGARDSGEKRRVQRYGSGDMRRVRERLEDVTEIIAGCREDMAALWEDAVVRAMLKRRKVRLEDAPGFFLDDIDRIAQRKYDPADEDVVRARLRTVGVQEYSLVFEESVSQIDPSGVVAKEWTIYDVGGSRTSRAAWLPFFEDANAIIFLAPISCFNETLAEDRRVNRLEDSFALWKSIVSSKLLAKCIIVLFLNKYDVLQRKIAAGLKVIKYMPSFGERENTAPAVAKYLHHKFKEQYKELSPEPRSFFGYLTSVIDTKATASTLSSVRDGLFRQHLKDADLVW